LKKAVSEWPKEAKQSSREAVQLLVAGKNRKDVVSALAVPSSWTANGRPF